MQLRVRCVEYLAELLEKESAVVVLQEAADKLEAAVLRALNDGDGDVRVMARRAYIAFGSIWNDRAQRCGFNQFTCLICSRIWGRLEYGTQRQLESERKAKKGEKRDNEGMQRPQNAAKDITLPSPISMPRPVIRLAPTLAASGSPLKRARTADPVPPAPAVAAVPAPALNLKRSLSLAANTAKMLSLAKVPLHPRPNNS